MATKIDRLIAYWEELRLGEVVPERFDVMPTRLARDGILSCCFVMDLQSGCLRVSGASARPFVGEAGLIFSNAFVEGDRAAIIECLDTMRRLHCGWFLATACGNVMLLPLAVGGKIGRAIGVIEPLGITPRGPLALLAAPERRSRGGRPHVGPLLRVIEGGRK